MGCGGHNHRLLSVLQTTDNYRCIVENTITDCICSSDHRRLQVHCGEHNHRLYLFFRPQTTTGALWRTQSQTVSVLQTTDNYRCIVENTITDCICSSDHRQLQMHCREHNHRLHLFFRPQTTTGALWRTQSQTVSVLQTTDNYRCIVENTITDCICSSDHRQLQVHGGEHNHRLYLFFRPQTTTDAL